MAVNISELCNEIRAGKLAALARAITLIESTRDDHRQQSLALLEALAPYPENTQRIGITGVPGVGKSTLIENLGQHLLDQQKRLAILTIDPTSNISGGSILGDKTRMPTLSQREGVFIRPSPSGNTLGGVTRHTQETILLCEAAGFNFIIVETLGVGQSEISVAEMVDMFLLLLLPNSGDELQGIKRGIMELADLILVNKADGEQETIAQQATAEYTSALRFMRPRLNCWQPEVLPCSAFKSTDIENIDRKIDKFFQTLKKNAELKKQRTQQAETWLQKEVTQQIMAHFQAQNFVSNLEHLHQALAENQIVASVAANKVVSTILNANRKQPTDSETNSQ